MAEIINTEIIPLSKIVENRGQLKGLPRNPRIIKDEKFQLLCESISAQPDMLYLRELLVFPSGSKYVVIGGNMRLKAMRSLGLTEAPCKVIPAETPMDQVRQILLKDNSNYGDWDTQELAFNWDDSLIVDCGIDFDSDSDYQEHQEKKRRAWKRGHNSSEQRCDLVPRYSFHKSMDFGYLSCFRYSEEGYLLHDIKANEDFMPVFAENSVRILRQLGLRDLSGYCLVSAPKRRHKERNFADGCCEIMSNQLGIPYYPDIIRALNKNRTKPKFEWDPVKEKNVIFFDDILTTGSTMIACNALMTDYNVINVIGINNHHQSKKT